MLMCRLPIGAELLVWWYQFADVRSSFFLLNRFLAIHNRDVNKDTFQTWLRTPDAQISRSWAFYSPIRFSPLFSTSEQPCLCYTKPHPSRRAAHLHEGDLLKAIESYSKGRNPPPPPLCTAPQLPGPLNSALSFLGVHEDQVFSLILGWGWYFGDVEYCPATCCHTCGCPGVQVIIHGPGMEVVPLPVSSQGARNHRPCQNSRRRCFRPPFSVLLSLFSQGGQAATPPNKTPDRTFTLCPPHGLTVFLSCWLNPCDVWLDREVVLLLSKELTYFEI